MAGEKMADSPTATTGNHGFDEAAFERANSLGEQDGDDEESPHTKAALGDRTPEGELTSDDSDPAKAERGKTGEQSSDTDLKKDEEKSLKTARRFEKLLKERAEARAEALRLKQTIESERQLMKRALLAQQETIAKLKERLAEYETIDGPEQQLEELKRRERLREEIERERAELRRRFLEEEEERLIREAQEELYDAMDSALEGYPHLTREQLRQAFKAYAEKHPNVRFEDAPRIFRELAKKLDEEIEKRYEARILEKHRPKLRASEPIDSNGTVAAKKRRLSTAEIAADLERVFGPGYFD